MLNALLHSTLTIGALKVNARVPKPMYEQPMYESIYAGLHMLRYLYAPLSEALRHMHFIATD
ncbi:unnamed protein product, partial [Ceratitis capitata]